MESYFVLKSPAGLFIKGDDMRIFIDIDVGRYSGRVMHYPWSLRLYHHFNY
jgi:hypothetical protein